MVLVYINAMGRNWKGDTVYEFLFSESIENIDGDDWDAYPASGQPSPPSENSIISVGVLTSKLKLNLIQNSDTFAVWDAVDGVIALGWEDISDYEVYPDKRTYFNFGEDINSVNDKLYQHDLLLSYNSKSKKINNEN